MPHAVHTICYFIGKKPSAERDVQIREPSRDLLPRYGQGWKGRD